MARSKSYENTSNCLWSDCHTRLPSRAETTAAGDHGQKLSWLADLTIIEAKGISNEDNDNNSSFSFPNRETFPEINYR